VDVPHDVRGFSTLPTVDYVDAFLVDASEHPARSAHDWAVTALSTARGLVGARAGGVRIPRRRVGLGRARPWRGLRAASPRFADRHARRAAVRAAARRIALLDVHSPSRDGHPSDLGDGATRARAYRVGATRTRCGSPSGRGRHPRRDVRRWRRRRRNVGRAGRPVGARGLSRDGRVHAALRKPHQ
jgi:hypothetical protein